jgi:uncharacterized protein (DUF433 family)
MDGMPVNEFVEMRGRGYYLAGRRVSLDSIAYELREGRTLAEIIEDYSALEGEEGLVQGAIDYIRAHQAAVDAYLVQEEERYEELRRQNPPPASVLEKIRKYRAERGLKSA